ncbi:MAG TPA: uroporphyrinogen-III C-methyltransferase [Burkholderiaceae bacterium]
MSVMPPDDSPAAPAASQAAALPAPPARAGAVALPRWVAILIVAVMLATALASGLLWQKLNHIQEELARRSADSGSQAVEARALAKGAQDLARETAAKLAVSEARLSEVALQRSQLEELMQSLSRSRDENLVVDIESSIRLAQQQAQVTGSVEPLLLTLKTADQRIARAAQPRLTPLQRARQRDLERVKAATVTDLPSLLIKLDDLTRLVDDVPLANAVSVAAAAANGRSAVPAPAEAWWQRGLRVVAEEARGLLRVSRIEEPESVLLAPEQAFFLRENLKLKLLNARLGLLARQTDLSQLDLNAVGQALRKYCDPGSRKTQSAIALLTQVQAQMKTTTLPRIDDTLAALATAAAGR